MKTVATSSKRKSWSEKLNTVSEAKVEIATGKYAEKFGEGKFVVATPKLVDALMRKVPKGKLATVNLIRADLTKQFDADYACPLATGIFVWICSNAAEEARSEGAKRITPWWRIVKEDGGLNPKAPGGESYQAKLLRAEGFQLTRKSLRSEKLVVKNAQQFFIDHF